MEYEKLVTVDTKERGEGKEYQGKKEGQKEIEIQISEPRPRDGHIN